MARRDVQAQDPPGELGKAGNIVSELLVQRLALRPQDADIEFELGNIHADPGGNRGSHGSFLSTLQMRDAPINRALKILFEDEETGRSRAIYDSRSRSQGAKRAKLIGQIR